MVSAPPRPKILSSPPRPLITSAPLVPLRVLGPLVPTIVAAFPWHEAAADAGAATAIDAASSAATPSALVLLEFIVSVSLRRAMVDKD
jgi:hypothetical protein